MSYEWITAKDFQNLEVNQAYKKYLKAKKATDILERSNWFEYWLDYLHLKNRYGIYK
tara:strand:- start:777 stop:947 length:171 start_codon:yes stop_codon:yes gene_type:complete